MFKRANKITSLLVAAAAVVSLAPTAALAADTKKIDSEDGVVYNAVAYKDGKAIIDGEVEDNDAAYFYADGKYTQLEDLDSGSDYAAYGTKYANVDEGDYFVDLEAGTVTDDSVDEDDEDDAASALRKEIKGSDRYTDNAGSGVAEAGDADIADLALINGNKFGDNWYSAKYLIDLATTGQYDGSIVKAGVQSGDTYDNVYTDAKGNYIDADYNLGKIKVETTGAGISGSVTLENTIDTETLKDGSTTVAVVDGKIVKNSVKELGQDKDNIYRYAQIEVSVAFASAATTQTTVKINGKVFDITSGSKTLDVIQKISKAQASDDIDDAKYAKTVTNYVISDDSAKPDAKYLALATATGTKASVVGGKLVLLNVEDKATATTGRDETVLVQAATLKSKNGFYYTDTEDQANITPEYSSDLEKTAVDTDVDGNIYVVDGGYVKEFDGTDDWNKIYKVDGSFDSLSVYDKDNMVTWSQGDEVYSIIGGKTTDETPATPETPVVTAGWAQTTAGWTYVKADGTKATGWLNDGGVWYYLKADGVMATGWLNDAGTWYYLNASGAMATGWLNDAGTWYYLNASGAMLANTTVDGYVLGASGAWVK